MKEVKTPISRRYFLKSTGCLTIGFPLLSSCWSAAGASVLNDNIPSSLKRHPTINAWMEVLEDGSVRIFTGKLELGQGIRTAIAQVAAEELDMDINLIEVHLAETGRTPDESYTAGSASIENSAMSVRYAAAAGREKLLALAAQKLNTNPDQLSLKEGVIIASNGEDRLTFAEVLEGAQIEDEISLPVALKPKDQYRWVGKAVPRKDIEHMVRGEPVYVQDLRFPGMVHARVIRPTSYQAKLQGFDKEALNQQVPGLLKTVVNGSFLGVIAEEEYQAVKAQAFLQTNARWASSEPLPQDQPLQEYLKSLPARTENVLEKGSFNTSGSKKTVKATYFKPYIMHASIGPSCAVALYDQDQLHLWSHSQGVYRLRESLQAMLGMVPEQIHIKGVPGSGCYGHNGADDVAADAALLAMAYPGKHIRLQWSREDEHGWEPYGCAMIMEAEASLDTSGRVQQWRYELWSDTHSTRPGGEAANLLPARYLEQPFQMQSYGYSGGGYRNSEPYYNIPNLKIDAHFFDGPLRVSALRSLGAFANVFAIESFMDELAAQAGKDPLAFRLMHAQDERTSDLLKKLQELTRNQKAGANEGIGYAFSRYKNVAAYCAVAAKVAVDKNSGEVQVQKMWATIDAGETINLDGLKNQTEGGMIQAASWTLKEEVLFDQQHITSRNWGSYPIFRFRDVPQVEVAVIDRPDQPALGAGEAAQGPAGAAIANAVYQACGKRVRHLPIRPEKITG